MNGEKVFAYEASEAIIKYCFKDLKLSKITLGVVEDNINAVKLYKKLGFTTYDKIKNFGTYNNKNCDSLRMILDNDR